MVVHNLCLPKFFTRVSLANVDSSRPWGLLAWRVYMQGIQADSLGSYLEMGGFFFLPHMGDEQAQREKGESHLNNLKFK